MKQLHHIQTFLLFFTKRLRLSNPWNFKAPFLICVPYFILLVSNEKPSVPLLSIIFSILIIIGIAGIGYLTNDLGDKEKDKTIGKENVTSELSLLSITTLFVLFFSFALIPWFFLKMNVSSFILLAVQFSLFYMYAFPPFRFKERGFLGILTDSLYAHVNPAILASLTFYLITNKSFPTFYFFLFFLGSWQFVLGIRNIIFHQLKDANNDLQSNTKTFVTEWSIEKSTFLVTHILLPLEAILLIAFLLFINYLVPYFIIAPVAFWLVRITFIRTKKQNLGFREYAYLLLDDLYIKWIPLVVLGFLCVQSITFVPVLILHFVLFRTELKSWLIRKLG